MKFSSTVNFFIVGGLALLVIVPCIYFLFFEGPPDNLTQDRYANLREQMVRDQIEKLGIKQQTVIAAMKKVNRRLFVPERYRDFAYADQPLPIGEGQTISQPYIVAFIAETLDLKKTDKVLEIGTGSGYQAAILAQLCESVYTIEKFDLLGKKAEKLLQNLGYTNIHVKIGDGHKGWQAYAPYDAIIVACSPGHIPQALKDQLAEGGRMIIPAGEYPDQELILLKKINGKLVQQKVLPVKFVPLLNQSGAKD